MWAGVEVDRKDVILTQAKMEILDDLTSTPASEWSDWIEAFEQKERE